MIMSYQQMEKSIVLERRSPDDSYKDPGISTLGFIPMINALWMNERQGSQNTELYSQYEIFYCSSCLISIIAPLLAMIIEYKM